MRTNGTIRAVMAGAETVNEYGEAVETATTYGTATPCAIATNSDTRLGRYDDGVFRQSSYTVLVEGSSFEADRVELVRRGERLGEFQVISIQPYETFNRVRIIV